MVQSPRKGHHPAIAYAAISRLEAHDPAVASGDSDRPGGIRSQRRKTEPSCGCGGGTAGRSARNPIKIPGIVNWTEIADGRAAAVGKFVEVRLTEGNGAGVLQSPNYFSVFGRDPIFE